MNDLRLDFDDLSDPIDWGMEYFKLILILGLKMCLVEGELVWIDGGV